ncbi:MAG: hypothetical protein MR982_04870, partial [Bacteroides pyogenes]|nr:hypothetical protein [Bacteroides pyogenes]MDY5433066.1 hypothetical protein [Bacteroides pyogenes]
YGVAFIPTLVLVNPDGRVAGSYCTLEETGLIRSLPALSPLPASGCGEAGRYPKTQNHGHSFIP